MVGCGLGHGRADMDGGGASREAVVRQQLERWLVAVYHQADCESPKWSLSQVILASNAGGNLPMCEILFVVEEADDGGYCARAVGHSIFTEADSLEELRQAVREAVDCHFEDESRPTLIRLHIVRDEVLTV